MVKRFDEPALLVKIKGEMVENLRRRGGPSSLLLTGADRPWTGKTLEAMGKAWNLSPIDAAIRIMRGGNAGHATSVASFNMIDSDVEAIMKQPWVVTSSDGSDGHPRQYATMPLKYQVYVKQKHVIDMVNFIRHSSGLTADMYGLKERGYLRPGYFADVAILDPANYAPGPITSIRAS
jgi:N-acyl-D-aspartate/D-glutamate deacylase